MAHYIIVTYVTVVIRGILIVRQPCYHIPILRDLGQWLYVPPFRTVCLFQDFIHDFKDF